MGLGEFDLPPVVFHKCVFVKLKSYLKQGEGNRTEFLRHVLFFNVYESMNFNRLNLDFFYLCFLSQRFTNHRTAREGGGHFFNSSLPLPPALHRNLDISRTITADSSPLHIVSSRTRPGNLWFPSASC